MGAALLLVAMISFFLSEVILPDSSQYVNDRGSLVFNQPLATEHYMFLLNSADLWADSGIEVVKGDKVDITVSGSFYSDIGELRNACVDNTSLLYDYFHKISKNTPGNRYVLSPEKPFGALLYRIERPVNLSLPLDSVPYIKEKRNEDTHEISFVAPTSGILHFSVNDIVLDKHKVDLIREDAGVAHLHKSASRIKSELYKDSVRNAVTNTGDTITRDQLARAWFRDNCGELLINVRVTRDVAKKSSLPFYDKAFIFLMRIFN